MQPQTQHQHPPAVRDSHHAAQTIVYWFRNDLRLNDNPALRLACQQATQQQAPLALVLCLPTARNTRFGFARLSGHRRAYLAQTVLPLAAECARMGQRLLIVEGDAASVLPTLLRKLGATHLYCEDIAAPQEQAEIAALQQHMLLSGCQLHTLWQSSLLEPSELPFQINDLPLVFTTFRNQVEKAKCIPAAPVAKISAFPAMPASAAAVAEFDVQAWSGEVAAEYRSAFCYQQMPARAGEEAALQHLQHYFQSARARTYKDTRNGLIGFDYSTKFSPWLATGALSARQIYQQLVAHEAQYGQNDSTYWIWFELLWRDYFRFLHLKFGNKLYHRHGLKSTGHSQHRDSIAHDPQQFALWCQGNTGQPLIDAGMRELHASGYLSNRMRQIVASFLVNDLQCDWRAGAAWFEAQLIDYDVYSNQGNWLYLAGYGTDPRSNRRFNLQKQQQAYDPEQAYLKLWLEQ